VRRLLTFDEVSVNRTKSYAFPLAVELSARSPTAFAGTYCWRKASNGVCEGATDRDGLAVGTSLREGDTDGPAELDGNEEGIVEELGMLDGDRDNDGLPLG